MIEFKPVNVKFALEFLQHAFEDIFTVKVLREWEALAEARTGETRLRQMYYLQQYIEKTLRAAAILYSNNSRKQEGLTTQDDIRTHGKNDLEDLYNIVLEDVGKANNAPLDSSPSIVENTPSNSFPNLIKIESVGYGGYFNQLSCWYSRVKYPREVTVNEHMYKLQTQVKRDAKQAIITYDKLPDKYKIALESKTENTNQDQTTQNKTTTTQTVPELDPDTKFVEAGSLMGILDENTYNKICLFTKEFQNAFQEHIFKPLVENLSSGKCCKLQEKDKDLIRFLSHVSISVDPENIDTIPELDFKYTKLNDQENEVILEKIDGIKTLRQSFRTKKISNPFDFSKIFVPLDIIDYKDENEKKHVKPEAAVKNNDVEAQTEKRNARRILYAIGMCVAAEDDLLTLKATGEWEKIHDSRKNVMAKKFLLHIHQVIEKYAKALCILNPHKEPVGGVFFKKIHNIKSLLTNVVLTEEESDTLENLVDLADAVKYPAENTANNDDNVLYSCDAELFLKNNSTLINDIFTKIKTKIKSECETYKFESNLFYKAMQGQFIDTTAKTGDLFKTNTRDDLTLVDDKHKKQASKTMLSWFKTQEESDKENINIGFRLFER